MTIHETWLSGGARGPRDPPVYAADARDSDPWVGRDPGVGNGTPLKYSCLENTMGTEA